MDVAVLIGIENYGEGIDPLRGPQTDVFRMAKKLKECGVLPKNIWCFANGPEKKPSWLVNPIQEPTSDILHRFFGQKLKELDGNVLIVYYAGHGIVMPDESRRLLCMDAKVGDRQNLNLDVVRVFLASDAFDGKFTERQIFIGDICGSYADYNPINEAYPNRDFGQPSPREVRQTSLFASLMGYGALNDDEAQDGVFSRLLLEQLNGSPKDWDAAKIVNAVKERCAQLELNEMPVPTFLEWLDGSNLLGKDSWYRTTRSIPSSLVRKLVNYFANDKHLLSLGLSILAAHEPQISQAPLKDFGDLITAVGELAPAKVADFVFRLHLALRNRPEEMEVSVGLEDNLNDWLNKYCLAKNIKVPIDEDQPHWMSFVVLPRPQPDRFDAEVWLWKPSGKNSWARLPVIVSKEDLAIEEAIAMLEAQIRDEKIPMPPCNTAMEFFVPIRAFEYQFEDWPSPRGVKLGFEISMSEDHPVVRRPMDYLSIKNRRERMASRESVLGVKFISDESPGSLFRTYDRDVVDDHACVGLCRAPCFPVTGRGDVFAATLGTGMRAMLWYRPTVDLEEAVRSDTIDFFKDIHPREYPQKLFEKRRIGAPWSEAILILDFPDRLPDRLKSSV